VYPTETQAREALEDLLKPYPAGHEWRVRLQLKFFDRPYLYKRGEALYGWKVKRDKVFGMQQVANDYEQKIIRLVTKLAAAGKSVSAIVDELDAQEKVPRHGVKWTKELVEQLLEIV